MTTTVTVRPNPGPGIDCVVEVDGKEHVLQPDRESVFHAYPGHSVTVSERAAPKPYDAILRGWTLGGNVLHGNIYEDTSTKGHHPFADGTPVTTNVCRSIVGGIATTASGTRYKLEQ